MYQVAETVFVGQWHYFWHYDCRYVLIYLLHSQIELHYDKKWQYTDRNTPLHNYTDNTITDSYITVLSFAWKHHHYV